MANPAVATKAIGIAKTLVRGSKSFLKGVASTSNSVISSTGDKIKATSLKIKNENLSQRRKERDTEELERRESREKKREKGIAPAATKLVDVVVKKPLASLWKLIAAWVVDNLPKILKEVEIFIKKVKVFTGFVKRAITSVGSTFKSLGKILSAFVKNIKEFDFTDKSGRIETAKKELDENLEDISTSVSEMGAVWGREEEELDYILEKFKSEDNVKKIRAELDKEFKDEEPAAEPQTPAVGKDSKSGKTSNRQALLDTISWAEGTSGPKGYNTWFGGRTDLDLAKLTINQVVAEQKKRQRNKDPRARFWDGTKYDYSFAVGKYQMLEPGPAAVKAGLDPSKAKFTPENQDKMAIAQYIKGQAGMKDSEIDSPLTREGIDKLAPVFASFPNLMGPDKFGKVGTNSSFYGQGGKKESEIMDFYSKAQGASSNRPETKPKPAVQAPQPASAPTGTSKVQDEFMGGTSGKIITTSKFGMREHPILGGYKMHNGIDLAPPGAGYRVALKASGEVTRVDFDGSGYGYFVIITSKETGKSYMFAHLKSIYVKKGDSYTGQAIGEIGSTGTSTGIHLHYEVYIGGKDGRAINPEPYLNMISIGKKLSKKETAAPSNVNSNLSGAKNVLLDGLASIKTGGAKIINNTILMTQKEYISSE